jgi:hypothetical protein
MSKYLTEKNLLWAILAVLTVVSVLQAKHLCDSICAPLPLKGK